MRGVLVVVGLTGCSQLFGLEPPARRDGGADAATDVVVASGDAPVGCMPRWRDGTITFATPQPIAELDGAGAQHRDPELTDDESTIYFSLDAATTSKADIVRAVRASAGGAFMMPADAGLSSSNYDSKVSLTADGLVAVLASNRTGTVGMTDLWYSERATTAAAWSTPSQAHLGVLNDPYNQLDPQLSPDGLRLYYSVSPVNNVQSIYVASRQARTDDFSAGTEIAELSSGTTDADPAPSRDELVMVFSSTRSGGLGLSDLWYSIRTTSGDTFAPPQLVPGVNSADADGDPWLSADGCRLYFASSKANYYQLYVATMN